MAKDTSLQRFFNNGYMTSPYLYPGLKISELNKINAAAAQAWGLEVEEMYTKLRTQPLIFARHAVVYYRLEVLKQRPCDVVRNNECIKSHATALHSRDVAEDLIKTDKEFKKNFVEMLRILKNDSPATV